MRQNIATASVSYTCDSDYGRLASKADGAGTTSYSYKPVGVLGAARLAAVDGPFANDTVTYEYDELGRVVSRLVNGIGTTRSYDSLGRVTTEVNSLGSFTYGYDGVTSRLALLSYPNGQTSTFTYFGNLDDRRLQTIHHKNPGGGTFSKFDYTYDKSGNVLTWQQQAGEDQPVLWHYAYDAADQLVSAAKWTTSGTPTILKRYSYGYDLAGNRTTEQIDDAATLSTYDMLNRLVSQQAGGQLRVAGVVNEAAAVTIAGAPARVGSDNRFEGVVPVTSGTNVFAIAAVDASGNVQTQQYQVDTAGPSRTFAYDANGNMINDGVRTFDWDGQDRLVAINKATHRTEFTYNELGERVVQKDFESSVLGQERRSIWLDGRIAEERDASGLVLRRRLPFGDVIGGASYFVTQDHLDSTRETTDGAATVHARYDYDPYGRSTTVFSDIDQPRGYSGGEVGSDGTVFAYRRAYDPELGRWLSEDPIGLAGGANLYEYVAGNPIRYVDPSGLRMTCSMTMARTKYKQAKTPCNKPGCTYADYAATWTECQETPCCGWKFDADVKLRVSVSYTVSKQESEYESHDTPGVSLAGHEALHVGDWRTWCALINGKFKTEGFKTKAECDKGQEWVREMGKGPFRSESREHDHPR